MKAIIPKRVIAFLFGIDYVAESAKQKTNNNIKTHNHEKNDHS